ncbi:MAG TPA: ATP-binding cassette domain-containing protein [Woeseiaceae bacterium]|nr:ATP-binding cassette domain-containing protein [Woeseiaceae bacterium]
MTLLVLDDISLDIGDQPLLRHATPSLEPNERVCLIGRNGAGKSTLLRIITGNSRRMRARSGAGRGCASASWNRHSRRPWICPCTNTLPQASRICRR